MDQKKNMNNFEKEVFNEINTTPLGFRYINTETQKPLILECDITTLTYKKI